MGKLINPGIEKGKNITTDVEKISMFGPYKEEGKKRRYNLTGILFTILILFLPAGSILITDFFTSDTSASAATRYNLSESSLNNIMAEVYIAPDGSDVNGNGTYTDPFATPAKAIEYVKNITASGMWGDIIVYFRGGYYELNDTLRFGPEDGGKDGYRIIYTAYHGERVIFSGGRNITDWTYYNNGIWKAPAPVSDFRQLYVNGERRVRARGPADFVVYSDGDGHKLSDDSIKNWKNLKDVEFVYKCIWTLPRIKVDRYDERRKILYMQQPAYAYARTKGGAVIDNPDWVENAFELLDEPGEWYFDRSEGTVYYIPFPDENMENITVTVPAIHPIIEIAGTSENKVKNLEFIGLEFAYGTWLKPDEYGTCFVSAQANVYLDYENGSRVYKMSPGNFEIEYADGIKIENCTFTHLGAGGLNFGTGTVNSSVAGSVFNDISGIAVQIGDIYHADASEYDPITVRNITVKNNYITNCSREYMAGPGIFTGYVRYVTISHNTISNLPYTGISVGWGWSSRLTVCGYNRIIFNRIYGIMNFLKDGGGIYTLSTQPGTNISYNVIHDSGWNGLYPDERTNGTVWSYNVVYNCRNVFLDHTLYDSPEWNKVYFNFFDKYPADKRWWYPERDAEQIWYPYTGYTELREKIIGMSEIEPAYRHLIPENEYYWHYTPESTESPAEILPYLLPISVIYFIGVCGAGIYLILCSIRKIGLSDVRRLPHKKEERGADNEK